MNDGVCSLAHWQGDLLAWRLNPTCASVCLSDYRKGDLLARRLNFMGTGVCLSPLRLSGVQAPRSFVAISLG